MTRNINLAIEGKSAKRIEQLRAAIGAKTHADVLKAALTLFASLIKATNNGYLIFAVKFDAEGKAIDTLAVDVLPRDTTEPPAPDPPVPLKE